MKKSVKAMMALVLVVALVAAMFAGCGETNGSTSGNNTQSTGTAANNSNNAEAAGFTAETIKVAMINTATAETSTWTSAHKVGFDDLCAWWSETYPNLPVEEHLVWVDGVDDSGADCGAVIDELVEQNCNVILTTSYGFMGPTQEKAKEYPNVLFYHNQSTDCTAPNQGVYDIRDYEAVFLTGYLTQLVCGGDSMAYIGSNPMPTVIRACNAFALGAKYANPNVTFSATFVNSWYDPTLEKESAVAMINNGATGIGMQVGSTAVVQACEEAGVPCSAFSQDLQSYGPNSVVTSFLWNWGPEYVYIVKGIIDGTLTGGEDIFLGLADDCGAVAQYNMAIVSEEQAAMADALMEQLLKGEVIVFHGSMTDNQGNAHGEGLAETEEMTDTEIRSMMWLVDFMQGSVG